ncbi:MAG: hypothetical protein FWE37_08920 [Spirochaetaceae bacterium]|nr:hypothetical protein [Spirochaetaceae bacterium]
MNKNILKNKAILFTLTLLCGFSYLATDWNILRIAALIAGVLFIVYHQKHRRYRRRS